MYDLENLNYLFQIIASIFVVIGGIVGLWQYTLAKRKEASHFEKEKITKAIEIADFYKENVLALSRKLKNVYKQMGMLSFFEGVKMDSIEHFDSYELKKIFTQEKLNQIKAIRAAYNIEVKMDSNSVAYRINANAFEEECNLSAKLEKEKMELGQEYVDLSMKILNNLEIFSMYFIHAIADESVVYQPLHMSYLEIIRMLYYDIAYANRNGGARFYINTIELFNLWKNKAERQENAEMEKTRNNIEKGNILGKWNIDK